MSNSPLAQLAANGVSIWLDDLSRSRIVSGGLRDLITNRSVSGVTTNPTIFAGALAKGEGYQAQVAELAAAGATAEQAIFEITTKDVADACDIFAGVYAESNGFDGRVSIEVEPGLANDTEGTVKQAKELFAKVNRENVMIKIPATQQGLSAIREMIAEGRNVNVTLIFSLSRYQEVMDAYIEGLEQRMASGSPVSGIASVASFFISRVDNEIDKRLDQLGTPAALALRGTAAVNQARLAYAAFQKTFSGPRWDALATAGASVQRPLWASTSTKNPSYPDTMYVDQLIGPDTVNTLPDATLEAFAEHGTVARTIDINIGVSRRQWAELAMNSIDVDEVAAQLEAEGVASFIKSFDELINALEDKAAGIL